MTHSYLTFFYVCSHVWSRNSTTSTTPRGLKILYIGFLWMTMQYLTTYIPQLYFDLVKKIKEIILFIVIFNIFISYNPLRYVLHVKVCVVMIYT
jgi:hypothetical protein